MFTYKGLQALQQKLQGKSLQSHSFLAACVGGWLVFGDNNNINSQVGQTAACGCQTCLLHLSVFRLYNSLLSTLDQHVPAVQNPVRPVSAGCRERIHPTA